VLLTHPCVADAAVIPYPDDEAGEVPKGIIVLREPIEPEAILEFVAERVAPHKRIRYLGVCRQDTQITVRKDSASRFG
jgi:acyl-coenzyme A synthetase/AMP-(fatty) acid ligase